MKQGVFRIIGALALCLVLAAPALSAVIFPKPIESMSRDELTAQLQIVERAILERPGEMRRFEIAEEKIERELFGWGGLIEKKYDLLIALENRRGWLAAKEDFEGGRISEAERDRRQAASMDERRRLHEEGQWLIANKATSRGPERAQPAPRVRSEHCAAFDVVREAVRDAQSGELGGASGPMKLGLIGMPMMENYTNSIDRALTGMYGNVSLVNEALAVHGAGGTRVSVSLTYPSILRNAGLTLEALAPRDAWRLWLALNFDAATKIQNYHRQVAEDPGDGLNRFVFDALDRLIGKKAALDGRQVGLIHALFSGHTQKVLDQLNSGNLDDLLTFEALLSQGCGIN